MALGWCRRAEPVADEVSRLANLHHTITTAAFACNVAPAPFYSKNTGPALHQSVADAIVDVRLPFLLGSLHSLSSQRLRTGRVN